MNILPATKQDEIRVIQKIMDELYKPEGHKEILNAISKLDETNLETIQDYKRKKVLMVLRKEYLQHGYSFDSLVNDNSIRLLSAEEIEYFRNPRLPPIGTSRSNKPFTWGT